MTVKPRSSYLIVRVTSAVRNKFHSKAVAYGKPSEVLRELIDAFNDDRVTIHPKIKGL